MQDKIKIEKKKGDVKNFMKMGMRKGMKGEKKIDRSKKKPRNANDLQEAKIMNEKDPIYQHNFPQDEFMTDEYIEKKKKLNIRKKIIKYDDEMYRANKRHQRILKMLYVQQDYFPDEGSDNDQELTK